MSIPTRSVVVRLKGGLGNQFFQYAAAKALSIESERELIVDTGWFARKNRSRAYRLDSFGINPNTIQLSKAQLNLASFGNGLLLPPSLRGLKSLSDPADLGFKSFDNISSDRVLLNGYWQSEKYFQNISDSLRQEIKPVDQIKVGFSAEQLKNAVAIHVRRGDYLAKGPAHVVSEQYIRNAMNAFDNNTHFIVCSDDVNWCKERFNQDNISFSSNKSDLEDFILMSQCGHNVIANSSFSWWSAWLNQNEGRRVIAPTPWTMTGQSHLDILPADWETIPI